MRVMAIVKGDQDPSQAPPLEALVPMFDQMGRFNERLAEAGVMIDGGGLLPSVEGKRIAYEDGETRIIDGPFAESKELIAGFWLLKVDSLDEALEWMRQAPFGGGFQLEIRPVADDDEFDEVFTDDMRARQERTKELIGRNVASVYA